MSRNFSVSVVAVVAILTGVLSPALGDEPVRPRDGMVREVVRMLEAGVEEPAILLWLERGRRAPGPLAADDLIALTRAKASPELTERLLAARTAPGPPDASASRPPVTIHATPPGETPIDEVPVEFSFRYRPRRDPELDDELQWQLYAYLDGQPLAWSEGKNWLSRDRRTTDVRLSVSPGEHVLRLVQERHHRRDAHWVHEARVYPEPIAFDAGGGERRVEVVIEDRGGLGFRRNADTVWRLVDAGSTISEQPIVERPADWPALCEELETSQRRAESMPERLRERWDRCVRWRDLWPGIGSIPDRAEVRDRLAAAEYRPEASSL